MAKDLDIVDRQLQLGQVKTIATGNILNYVELLFSPNIKSQYYFDKDNNVIQHCVKDCDLGVEGYNCLLDKNTLKTMIIYMKNLYNQLEDELEGDEE